MPEAIPTAKPQYSRAFVRRRRVNWVFLGLMYAAYYMCRYNLPIVNQSLRDHFGWSKEEMGYVILATMIAYAVGQLVNGLFADRAGGRRAILIGAVGTVILNIALGFGEWVGALTYFIVVWGLNGYFQAFGAPAIVKVNANWFSLSERGTFSGIFGLMIQFGRWAILLLGGGLILWLPWQWVFWIPAALTAVFAVLAYSTVRDNPEDLGFPSVEGDIGHGVEDQKPASIAFVLRKVLTSKVLWIVSFAYFCTGVVRHGLDQWYIPYLSEVHGVATDSFGYVFTAFGLPIAAVGGSFAAGIISDRLFQARRGPAAALMYFGQFAFLLLFTTLGGPVLSPALLVVVQFFVNGPHSLLGGAAAMDFGGRKSAGFASGLIDCWQYIGGGLVAGLLMGKLLDKFGWSAWIVSLVGFALLGGILMTVIWKATPQGTGGGK
jgi:OPA family glycerol-3-phosphate transporter-like MFS transporter